MIRRYLFLLLSLVSSLSLCIAQEYRQYVVQRGESKSYIASKFGLSEQELSDANPLFPTFYSGLSINVPIIERVKEEDKVQEASPSSTQKNRSNKRSGRSFWQVLGEVFALSVLPTPAPAPMPMPGYIPMPVPPPISIPEYTFQFGDNADVHSWGNGINLATESTSKKSTQKKTERRKCPNPYCSGPGNSICVYCHGTGYFDFVFDLDAPAVPVPIESGTSTYIGNNNSVTEINESATPTRTKCGNCVDGLEKYMPWLGSAPDTYCDICKKSGYPHSHRPCTICNGTGWR